MSRTPVKQYQHNKSERCVPWRPRLCSIHCHCARKMAAKICIRLCPSYYLYGRDAWSKSVEMVPLNHVPLNNLPHLTSPHLTSPHLTSPHLYTSYPSTSEPCRPMTCIGSNDLHANFVPLASMICSASNQVCFEIFLQHVKAACSGRLDSVSVFMVDKAVPQYPSNLLLSGSAAPPPPKYPSNPLCPYPSLPRYHSTPTTPITPCSQVPHYPPPPYP